MSRTTRRRLRQSGWDFLGLAVFAVIVFPVYWMISTAFKRSDDIVSLTPTWLPFHPTLSNYRSAMRMPFFWVDVKNSLIIVSVTVAISKIGRAHV